MISAESGNQKRRGLLTGRLRADVLAVATGEGVARLCNLILVVFLSRTFGVRATGAYAVAQALYLYQMNGTDFGLRQTGAPPNREKPGQRKETPDSFSGGGFFSQY